MVNLATEKEKKHFLETGKILKSLKQKYQKEKQRLAIIKTKEANEKRKQKLKEEKWLADIRMKEGKNQYSPTENLPEGKNKQNGEARDKAAEGLNFSGKTLENYEKMVNLTRNLQNKGWVDSYLMLLNVTPCSAPLINCYGRVGGVLC